MKILRGAIFLVLLSGYFEAYSQNVNVTFKYFIDKNKDCVKQPNEDSFFMNQRHNIIIKDNINNRNNYIVNDSAKMLSSIVLNLPKDSNLYFRTYFDSIYNHFSGNVLGFINSPIFIFRLTCQTVDTFFAFKTGNNDTSIYIPLYEYNKDTINSPYDYLTIHGLIVNIQLSKLNFNSCVIIDSTVSFHNYLKAPYKNVIYYKTNWGDGVIDSMYFYNKFSAYPTHKYNKVGQFIIKNYILDSSGNQYLTDSFDIHISPCNRLIGAVYSDTNNNCNFENYEQKFKKKNLYGPSDTSILFVKDSINSNNQFAINTDSLGNYQNNDTLDYLINSSYDLDTGTYYVGVYYPLRKFLSCQDASDSLRGYRKVHFSGYNQTIALDLGVSDSTFIVLKSSNLPLKNTCNGDTTLCNLNISYNGTIKLITDWGDGIKDTLKTIDSGKIKRKHLYGSLGIYKIKNFITDKTFKIIDSIIDSVNSVTCFNLTGKIYFDSIANCQDTNEFKLKNTIFSVYDLANNFISQDTTDSQGNFSFNQGLGIGTYKAQIKNKFLNCASSSNLNGDFYHFSISNGTSNKLEIPIKDTTYILTKKFNFELTGYCILQDAKVIPTLTYNGNKVKSIIEWGDGNSDTLSPYNHNGQKLNHKYSIAGKYFTKFKIFTNNKLTDSIVDSIKILSCFELKGKVFLDKDTNCNYSSTSDQYITYYSVSVRDSTGKSLRTTFTDNLGNYSFMINNYGKLFLYVNDLHSCIPNSKQILLPNNTGGVVIKDIGLNPNTIDYSVYVMHSGIIFPGDESKLRFNYNGLASLNPANYSANIPSKSTIMSANGTNTLSYSNGRMFVNYSTSNIYNQYYIYRYDTTVTGADTFCFNVRLKKVNGEPDTSNNETTICRIALNSYDPNDKSVSIRSMEKSGNFYDKNDYLNYTIRFQNTGTAPARNIYILDTIDNKLDLTTIKYLGSSHNAQLSLDENRLLRIDFKNINLIDSATNSALSQGYIAYSIKPISNLDTGDLIENTANIYFDFNPPIITNTTKNRFIRKSIVVDNGRLSITEKLNNSLAIFPIPSSDFIYFNQTSTKKSYTIQNITGKQVAQGICNERIDISNLEKGIYFISIEIRDKKINLKFVKE